MADPRFVDESFAQPPSEIPQPQQSLPADVLATVAQNQSQTEGPGLLGVLGGIGTGILREVGSFIPGVENLIQQEEQRQRTTAFANTINTAAQKLPQAQRDILGRQLQLGDFAGAQNNLLANIDEQSKKELNKGFIGLQVGNNPQLSAALNALPAKDQLAALRGAQVEERAGISQAQRDRSLRLQEASNTIRAQGLQLSNLSRLMSIEDKKQRDAGIAASKATLQPIIASLPGNEQVKIKAALARNDFNAVQQMLKPAQPKPGSMQGLFKEIADGNASLDDLDTIKSYFNSKLGDKKGEAAYAQFEAQYTKDESPWYDWLSDRSVLPNAAAAVQAAAGDAPIPPYSTEPAGPAATPRRQTPVYREGDMLQDKTTGQTIQLRNNEWVPVNGK